MAVWIEPEPAEIPAELAEFVGGHPLIAQTLFRRGIRTVEQAGGYLKPEKYSPASSLELPGMRAAVERIESALQKQETICVWGDFDVDGQTATSVLVQGLRRLGADVFHHIPVRAVESHGVNIPMLKKVIAKGAALLLTCDTGIANHEPLAYAAAAGLDVIVTDHHTLPPDLPEAVALVNPQMLPEEHPLRTLPGVGVAYKLMEILYERAGLAAEVKSLLDLVALGIVADLAVLKGDTRFLLQLGLVQLRNTGRAGLQALYEVARIRPESLNEETIGYAIGPRLNALGRLDDANPIVDFLTSEDLTLARVTASRLEGLNEKRRMITEQIFEGAVRQIEKNPELARMEVLVLAQENWEPGIIGIVASRMVELYRKPAILIALDGSGIGRGSARSVEGVNITGAIAAQQGLLRTYGGHPMAAGLSLDAENIERFRTDLAATVRAMPYDASTAEKLPIDGCLQLGEITIDLAEQFAQLGPFGSGNPPLTFCARNVIVKSERTLGKTGVHLRLVIEGRPDELAEVVWWRGSGEPRPDHRFDLAFNLGVNDFNGERRVQMVWQDARPIELPEQERPARRERVVIDCRTDPQPEERLGEILALEDVIAWGEGVDSPQWPLVNRADLKTAGRLVIWTIPPHGAELAKAVEKVGASEIYLFGMMPESQQVRPFLGKLAGLLKYTLSAYSGRVSLRKLAGLTAQTESCVLAGLAWLSVAGHFTWEQKGRTIYVAAGSGEPSGPQNEILARLQRLLSESEAYRRNYLRVEIDALVS